MEKKDLTPFIGIEFTGLTYTDLKRQDVFDEFIRALHSRQLVVVRGIAMTPVEQLELAARIGRPIPFVMGKYRHTDVPEIMISSNEVSDNKPIGVARVGNFWHLDSSYLPDPPTYTLLHGVRIPKFSGDTLFASAIDLFERLPESWKAKIAERRALHTVDKRARIGNEHVGLSIAEFRALIAEQFPKVEHPLVRQDCCGGRSFMYAASEYLDSVVGFDANENAAFMRFIDDLTQDPDHVYTHRWTSNDLVTWKTATTLHAVTAIAPGLRRRVHRISIESSKPCPA